MEGEPPEPPPYQPDYSLIVCMECGRRLYDDDGTPIRQRWWRRWLGC